MNRVKTSLGEIEGVDMGSYSIFKGVPYAKPPVGELRWKAPQPCDPWEGVLQAKRFPKRGWQEENEAPEEAPFWKKKIIREYYSDPSYTPEMDEDILYLNIWVPNDNAHKLPVAFWIHGGGFGSGWGSEMEFDGAKYCERGVILVTINYRLGMLGNLVHDWLIEEDPRHVSGNYGILDQIQALRWVHDHIADFGGDPENITIFGQSAGAMSAQLLVSSELTENLISKAIFQSGGCHHNVMISDSTYEASLQTGREFVEFTGAKNLEELRAMPAEQLEQMVEEFSAKKQQGILFMPAVDDGVVFPENPTDCLEHNRIKNIPYILGTNESDLMVSPEMIYSGEKSVLYKGCIEWSQKMQQMNNKPSYVYYMNHHLPGDDWGAFHGAELWYMFGTLDRCWRPFEPEDYALCDQMMDYWTSFMKTGTPCSVQGVWRPCTEEDPYVQVF